MSETYDELRRRLIEQGYLRSYEPWTPTEEVELKRSFEVGSSIREISDQLRRTPGAIRSRLIKIGLIEDSEETSRPLDQSSGESAVAMKCEPPPATVSKAFNEHWDLVSKLTALGMEHLEVILPNISERDRDVMIELLGTRDGKRKTLQEVSDIFGISKQRVSQLRKRVRLKLLNKIL